MPAKSIPVAKTCEVCGTPFDVKPSRASKARYCSGACQGKAKAAAGLAARPRKTCPMCGATFTGAPAVVRDQVYCSIQCQGRARQGVKIALHRIHRCEVCGSEYEAQRRSPRYCSSTCYGISQIGVRRPSKGRYVEGRSGYVYIRRPEHPKADARGYVAEHRLVAEEHLGRLLTPKEVVHHKDGDTSHNVWDNLEVMTQAEHARLHKTGSRN